MGKAGLILSLLALVACAAPSATPSAAAPPAGCDAARYQTLIGQPASAIDAGTLPRAHRIVCHDCMMTMDFSADRLTVKLDPAGRVESATCQ